LQPGIISLGLSEIQIYAFPLDSFSFPPWLILAFPFCISLPKQAQTVDTVLYVCGLAMKGDCSTSPVFLDLCSWIGCLVDFLSSVKLPQPKTKMHAMQFHDMPVRQQGKVTQSKQATQLKNPTDYPGGSVPHIQS
jgi:hypothetical protein